MTPVQLGADVATVDMVAQLVRMTGADDGAPTQEAAADLVAYLIEDRQAGDTYTLEAYEEARPLVHTSASFNVINDRCKLGATVWAYRGVFGWEF